MSVRGVSGAFAGAITMVALVLVSAAPAQAHNQLRNSSPSANASVAKVPSEVGLTFAERALAIGSAVRVTGPAGNIAVGTPRLVGTEVHQSLRTGAPAGRYTVAWRVTSIDGHPVSGTFTFTVRSTGNASPSSPSSPSPATTATPATTSAASGGSKRSSLAVAGYAGLAGAALGAVYVVVQRRRRPPP